MGRTIKHKGSIIYAILMLVYFVIILCGSIVVLSSCSQKAWNKRGVKKGWIDTSTVREPFVLQKDTLYRDSIVEVFINRLDSIYQIDTIRTLDIRTKIKYIIKTEFLPSLEKSFKDTTFVLPDGLKLKLKFTDQRLTGEIIYKKTEVKDPEEKPWYQKKMAVSFQGFLLILVLVILILFIIFRKLLFLS